MLERKHEDWIKAYMEYSKFSEAPNKFHFWTAVSCIAGALRRKCWIDQGYFQWTPNFYIVFVAPPGIVSKSTTASIGMKLLHQIEGIKFGPDAVTWQALIKSLSDSTEMFQIEGSEDYYPMSAITIISSEFGTFLNPSDREMVDMLVSLWDGQIGTWKKSTKTQGSDQIENPWVNILACTTPAWIAGNFPDYLVGGGFTSRCVFVYGEKKRHLVAYPGDKIPKNFAEQAKDLVHDLDIISKTIAGEYTLTNEAKSWGEEWYKEHYKRKPTELDGDRFSGYLARKQTHIHKLAIILSAAKDSSRIINEDILEKSAHFVTALEDDMPKVFSHIGVNDDTKNTKEIILKIRAYGEIDKQSLLRECLSQIDYRAFELALEGAIAAGYVKLRVEKGVTYVRSAKTDK